MDQIWRQIQEQLKSELGPQNFEIWIRPIRFASRSADQIYFHVPNRYYRDWVRSRYRDTIQHAFQHALAEPVTIHFLINDENPPGAEDTATPTAADSPTENSPAPSRPLTFTSLEPAPSPAPAERTFEGGEYSGRRRDQSSISPGKTFDNFVVGACNAFAHATARAVAETPGTQQYNPLYIYGSTGLGKTHLLHAIGNQILAKNPDAYVLYVSAEQFTNDLIDAIRYRRMPSFRERYRRRPTVLLMDDVQFLSNKDRTQEELFHTFEWLKERGRQIVFTSDVLPRDIKMFEPRLRTRFESGMLADTQPPDMETMIAILQQKAEDMFLPLPHDLAQYIASRVRGNIRELEGILNRLKALCQLHSSPPTVEFARTYLSSILADEPHALSAEDIIQTVASFFNIKVADLKGKRRLKQFVRPRHIAMWLIRQHTEMSFPDIGRAFNGRDHATVQHACKKVVGMMERDADLETTIKLIERGLGR